MNDCNASDKKVTDNEADRIYYFIHKKEMTKYYRAYHLARKEEKKAKIGGCNDFKQ